MTEPLYRVSVMHKWFSYLRCPQVLLSFSVFGYRWVDSQFLIHVSKNKQTNSAVVVLWLESQVISGKPKILPGKIQNDLQQLFDLTKTKTRLLSL